MHDQDPGIPRQREKTVHGGSHLDNTFPGRDAGVVVPHVANNGRGLSGLPFQNFLRDGGPGGVRGSAALGQEGKRGGLCGEGDSGNRKEEPEESVFPVCPQPTLELSHGSSTS